MPFYKNKSFFNLLILFSILISLELYGHGFGPGTLVKTYKNGSLPIEQVCLKSCHSKKQKIASYNPYTRRWVVQLIKSAGQSQSNCYLRISFDDNSCHDIVCTPTQEFFLSSTRQWVQACALRAGDLLVRENEKSIQIAHIEFVKEPAKVYSLEVKKTHSFFVGHYSILTHNMVLPMAFSAGLSVPFGGALIGAAGSFFGPLTMTFGIGLGTVIGLAVKAVYEDKIPTYKIPLYDESFVSMHGGRINAEHSDFHDNESIPLVVAMGSTSANSKKKRGRTFGIELNAGMGSGNPNDDDKHKERKKNMMSKSEFFNQERVKKNYESYRDGIYRRKSGAEGIENAEYLQWDHLHNDVEAYSKSKSHLGSIDPKTLKLYKNPVGPRKIDI